MVGAEHVVYALLRTRWGTFVVVTLACVAATIFLGFAVPAAARWTTLAGRHVAIDGAVIESRAKRNHYLPWLTDYALRYSFRVNHARYEHMVGGREAWSDLSKQEWDAAVRSGRVAVIYDPADPNNNDVAAEASWLELRAIGVVMLAVTLTVAAYLWAALKIAALLRRRMLPAASGPTVDAASRR